MSARSTPRSLRGWALTAVTVVALVGAALLAIAGIRASGGDAVVLVVDDAVAEVTPPTVPLLVTTTTVPPTRPQASPPAPTTTTPVLSPLAALLGERSTAIPEEIEPRPRPVGLDVSSIDVVRYPVREVGLEDDGQLEIPDETEIGWYRYGATAGRPGATVLAAHVNWRGSLGPFAQLGSVEPGDRVEVALDDGTTRTYEVTERTTYGKLALPRERIWRTTGPEELVLITCGGEFNPDISSYRSNIVVYAVPVGSSTATAPKPPVRPT